MLPIQLQFQHLGVCTKLVADFINKLPFLLPLDSYSKFTVFNSEYRAFHLDYQTLMRQEVTEQETLTKLASYVEIVKEAHAYGQQILQIAVANVKDEALQREFDFCKEKHAELFTIQDKDASSYASMKQALEKKLQTIIKKIHELTLAQLPKFLAARVIKIIRLQRIIIVYQGWYQLLQTQRVDENNLGVAITMQQLCTYDKKAWLNNRINTQTWLTIIHAFTATLRNVEHLPDLDMEAYLSTTKQKLKSKILSIESQLKARQTYIQALIATSLLGISRQPEYQLGQLATHLNVDICDRFPNTPIIGVKLPPHIFYRLTHAVGLTFLSITLYVANRIGYSFQLIAFFNRIILAQYNLLLKLGKYVHIDEISLSEHDKIINFITGLGIQLSLTLGYNVTPLVSGYIIALSFANATSNLLAKWSKKLNIPNSSLAALQTIIHVITYCYVYSFVYKFMFVDRSESVAKDKAFATLGLGQDASARDIHIRYRDLAKLYHPDLCKANCEVGRERMEDINHAYAVLR